MQIRFTYINGKKIRLLLPLMLTLMVLTISTSAQEPFYEDYIGVRLGDSYEYELIYYKGFGGETAFTFGNQSYTQLIYGEIGNSLNISSGQSFTVFFDPESARITGHNIDIVEYTILVKSDLVYQYLTLTHLGSGDFISKLNWDEQLQIFIATKVNHDQTIEDPRDRFAVIDTSMEFGKNTSECYDTGDYYNYEWVYDKTTGMLLYKNGILSKSNGTEYSQLTIKQTGYERDYPVNFAQISETEEDTVDFSSSFLIMVIIVSIYKRRRPILTYKMKN